MSTAANSYCYLDTSALVHWALGVGGSPEPDDKTGMNSVAGLIASDCTVAATPVTLVELNTVLYTKVRAGDGWLSKYGTEELDEAWSQLMTWLETEEILVRNLGLRTFEKTMACVSDATCLNGRNVRAWDVVHLYEALRWADEVENTVAVATSDQDFAVLLEIFPEFGPHVQILDVTQT